MSKQLYLITITKISVLTILCAAYGRQAYAHRLQYTRLNASSDFAIDNSMDDTIDDNSIAQSELFAQSTETASIEQAEGIFNPVDQLEPETEPLTGEECIDAISILDLITPPTSSNDNQPIINVPLIVQEDIYKKTTGPVTRRSLLDEPTLRPYLFNANCWTVTIQPFYNYSPRVYFTKNSPFLSSYINLSNENIINEITRALEEQEFSGNIDIPEVLGLFSNIKLQQHRSGFMFAGYRKYHNFNIMYRIPLYYLVEHFFLTPREKERLENSEFFLSDDAGIGTTPEDEVDRFLFRHLVSDKIGLGDSRINALYNVYKSVCTNVWLGAFVTLPTAKAFKTGILGRDFDICLPQPNLNIKRLFNLYLCQPDVAGAERETVRQITQEASTFLVGALDRLSANLINSPLGNGGHFGIGPQLEFKKQFTPYLSSYGFLSLEWFNSAHEKRFYLLKKCPSEFERDWRNEETAEQNLTFLNTQINALFYTIPACTTIKPGMITNFRYAFMYDSARWHSLIGFDYWRQGKEKIESFPLTEPCHLFDICKEKRPAAQQGKIFLSLGYYSQADCHDFTWHVIVTGSGTIFHTGIGSEYAIGTRVGIEF